MVIQDDNIGALCGGNRLMRESAAIDANDQVMALCKLLHRGAIGAIAFIDAIGHIERRSLPKGSQPPDQLRG